MSSLQSLLGLFVFFFIAFIFSRNKKGISYRFVLIGIISQFVIAFILLKIPFITNILMQLNHLVNSIQSASDKASQYMFGYLAGGPPPFQISAEENTFIIAFQVLPLILVITALSAMLFHFGILGKMVSFFSFLLRKFFPISGALGLGSAATLFFGTIEAPLLIKPYLKKMSRAELFSLIVCSMSTIAGTVMVLYASVLGRVINFPINHLITASIISIPAALTLSHLFDPYISKGGEAKLEIKKQSWIEALLEAIEEGIKMVLSIAAIIIVLFSFVYLFNDLLSFFHPSLSIQMILSYLLQPVMWLVGFDWQTSHQAAELMGIKIILNEFVSYLELAKATGFTSQQKEVLTYSLCGFANIASAGIIIAGLTTILPDRRKEVVRSTFLALIFGNLATLSTACVVAIL